MASTKIRASSDLSDTATSLSFCLTAKVTGCWRVQEKEKEESEEKEKKEQLEVENARAPAGGFGGGAGGLGPAGIPFLQAPLAKQTQSLFPRRPTLISF